MLVDAGMEKINFSGGEPFLHQVKPYSQPWSSLDDGELLTGLPDNCPIQQ